MKKIAFIYLFIVVLCANLWAQDGGFALHFYSIDSAYVEIPSNLKNLDISNAFTMSFWLNSDTWVSYRMLLQDGTRYDSCSFYLGVIPHNNEIFICIHTIDGRFYNDHVQVPNLRNNRWCAIAYSYDGSNIYVHFDGSLVYSYPWTGEIIDGNRDLNIGFRNWEKPFEGFIDELRIWNVRRSDEEIRENLHRHIEGNEEGLVGYWRFDDGEGNTAGDSTANNNDGILYGPTWLPSTAPLGPGQSDTEIVNAIGLTQFEDTGVDMDFTSKSETDTFVVTKIRGIPPGIQPEGITEITENYWVIRQYGNGTSTAELTYKFDEGAIRPEYHVTPDQIKLFYREFYSDSAWTLVASASSTTDSTVTFSGISQFGQFVIGMIENTSIPDEMVRSDIPREIRLLQNHPNPFNPSTTITYSIPKSEFVTLKVFDITGREIETLIETYQNPGSYTIRFANESLPDGIYLYHLQAGDVVETRKMIITK